jgi:hypothetical protein
METKRGNSAGALLWEAPMAFVSFPSVPANNPAQRGSLAAKKQRFGDNGRYAVAPVHTRFDAVEWFVWDAEHPLSDLSHAEVIRQAETLEEALRGL